MATWEPGDLWDPGNPENRDRTRRLQRELRAHLMRWDPIGIGVASEAQDEYDAYISPLLHRLHGREPVDAITSFLTSVVEDRMGVRSQPNRERQFAETLVTWWTSTTSE